jgi:HlyD family secretion protein
MTKKLIFILLWLSFFNPPLFAKEKIGAMGKITPAKGILNLVGTQGFKITEIKIKEGDLVKAGDLLVVFDNRKTFELELALARLASEEINELSSKNIALKTAQIQEADSLGALAIAIQNHRISAVQTEYDFAGKMVERFKKIEGERLSKQKMDERVSHLRITKANLESAKKELQRLTMDREIKVSTAKKELNRIKLTSKFNIDRTKKQVDLAKEMLNRSTLKAPLDGTILDIHARVGEIAVSTPIIRMADLNQMQVVAEVFEGDLLKIKPGLEATIESSALPGALKGKVESIGRIINPSTRTAKVKIGLLDPETASKFINMEVDLSIELTSS